MSIFTIESYNPLECCEKTNLKFIHDCKNLYLQNRNLNYLLHTGIMFSDEQSAEWQRSFDPNKKEYLVIKEEGIVIALAIIFKNNMDNFKLDALVVDENYHRQGIATFLINKTFETAKSLGFKSVETEVYADNQPMLINVISKGFKPIKIDYHKRFDGEDLIILKKYF